MFHSGLVERYVAVCEDLVGHQVGGLAIAKFVSKQIESNLSVKAGFSRDSVQVIVRVFVLGSFWGLTKIYATRVALEYRRACVGKDYRFIRPTLQVLVP